MTLDAVNDHFQCNQILATLQNNQVGVLLTGFHKLLVHGLDSLQILIENRLNASATLGNIATNTASQAYICIRVHTYP